MLLMPISVRGCKREGSRTAAEVKCAWTEQRLPVEQSLI